MGSSDGSQTRSAAALFFSVALHLVLLAVLAALLSGAEIPQTGPVERDAFIPITAIARRTPAPARLPNHLPLRTAPIAGNVPHAELRSQVLLERAPANRSTVDRPRPPGAARAHAVRVDPPPVAHRALLPAPAVVSLRTAPLAAEAAAPTPAPAQTPAPAAGTPVPAVAADYAGLFSQDYPPAAAAPEALAAIRGRLPAHLRIRIEVDETGHATDVQIAGTVTEVSVADEIRTALLALRYVPADCDGLHCDGVLTIDT